MKETPDEVFAQIFSSSLVQFKSEKSNSDTKILNICPDFNDVQALAILLADEPCEEQLQQFLEQYPRFLIGLCGFGYDSPLAFLVKPSVGVQYKADFAVLSYGQGGCKISLVEIKRSAVSLYTKKGQQADKLREAVQQIEDRNIWLNKVANIQTFMLDMLASAKLLPKYPKRSTNQSFRLTSPEDIDQNWRSFSGYDCPIINHIIIIGRWAKLSEPDQKRLVSHNRDNNQLYRIVTYDQVARYGFDRPYFLPP